MQMPETLPVRVYRNSWGARLVSGLLTIVA